MWYKFSQLLLNCSEIYWCKYWLMICTENDSADLFSWRKILDNRHHFGLHFRETDSELKRHPKDGDGGTEYECCAPGKASLR